MGTKPNKLFYYLYIIGFDAQRHKREDIIYLFIYWVVFVVYNFGPLIYITHAKLNRYSV